MKVTLAMIHLINESLEYIMPAFDILYHLGKHDNKLL